MDTAASVKQLLADTLQLGNRADNLSPDSPLLGAIPEIDSMAVVTILTAIEDEFGVTVEDDEINAETFETLGTLVAYVNGKLAA